MAHAGVGDECSARDPRLRAAAEAGEIAGGIDTDREAAALFFMIQGLIGPVLIGVLGPAEALCAGRSPARPDLPLTHTAPLQRSLPSSSLQASPPEGR